MLKFITRNKKYKNPISLFFLILFLLTVLSSCKGIEITGKTEDVEGYSESQVMVVLGSERNRYQEIFGSELWSMPIQGQQETEYGEYFITKTREFLQNIKTLNLLAQEKGIVATSKEMEQVRALSVEFYDGLSEADKSYFKNCSIRDVTDMYTDYFIANKTAEYILSTVDSEVSSADAKVIHVQQIRVSDEDLAQDLYLKVNVPGANFAYYARQFSEESVIERSLSRSEEENIYYDTAFSLEEGEISSIFEMDGEYYILKCTDSYDEDATQERKERLELAIRSTAFHEGFEEYAEQHIVRFREEFWKEIDLSIYPESTASNFFALYEERGL